MMSKCMPLEMRLTVNRPTLTWTSKNQTVTQRSVGFTQCNTMSNQLVKQKGLN